ncbi:MULTISPECIES: RHS repeat-associated core domain-containing protein [Flavobacterium]|uniref:RHS repeat-associated core domain-containing protein n=1 Tax=Flavobacterium jumunjinense TaxID=998845 RepID=A0ABV5GPQ7_9FLAO|nr:MULTISPECIES: RHS repeat-associated core domain-containing protein [Flavobacterium]
MGCLKLHTYTHLHIAHTSNTEHSREKKSDAGRYQYKYNGVELQTELGLNMYAMEMRQYDPAIARWVVQDPITHHSMSPYTAFDNNPTYWKDPSGADGEHYNWNTGQYNDGDGNVISFGDAMAAYGMNSDGSRCEKCEETIANAKKMIKNARSVGMNFAADNMAFFLSGKGGEKLISSEFLMSNQSVRTGILQNILKLFDKKFNKMINDLKLGKTINLSGEWTSSYYAGNNELDLLYGSGGYTISTKVNLKITRGETSFFNGYTISGSIDVSYFDEYNWDPGKGDYVPGIGYTDDNDFDELTYFNKAANFDMKSNWNINISNWSWLASGIQGGIFNIVGGEISH